MRGDLMKIVESGLMKGYVIHKMDTKYLVCKVLNEYENWEEASKDLIKLLTDKRTEKGLLKDFTKKTISNFSGEENL